jgi:hypothetical protein
MSDRNKWASLMLKMASGQVAAVAYWHMDYRLLWVSVAIIGLAYVTSELP